MPHAVAVSVGGLGRQRGHRLLGDVQAVPNTLKCTFPALTELPLPALHSPHCLTPAVHPPCVRDMGRSQDVSGCEVQQ